MDTSVTRGTVVVLLLVGPVVIGVVTADTGEQQTMPIDALLIEEPVGEQVVVAGAVTSVPEDYTANGGATYQRFHVNDGHGELLVFCSTAEGRTMVSAGDHVRVAGTFTERYGTYQVHTSCADVT